MPRARKEPWKRPKPTRARHAALTPSSKRAARRRAHKAGRRYPNLVDNMRAAARQRTPRKRA